MRIFPLLLLFALFSLLPAQEKVFFTVTPGYSFYSSENYSNIMESNYIKWYGGLSLGYETSGLYDMTYRFTVDLAYTRVNDIMTFVYTSNVNPYEIGEFKAHYVLLLNTIDLAIQLEPDDELNFMVGPSISWGNRSVVIEGMPRDPELINQQTEFEDRVATLCAGVNGAVTLETPFSTTPDHAYFFVSAKVRYLLSVWVDARGRNVSDYRQSFFIGQVNLGVGYNF